MSGAQAKTTKDVVAAGANEIIERAARHHITNIHIEPGSLLTLVRYRRGGELYVANKLPSAAAANLVRHFKKQAKLDLDQTAMPQTGRFELQLGDRSYLVEVDTMPVLHGEKITVGLHEVAKSAQSLEELGLWGSGLDDVKRALAQPRGLIIVGGRLVNNLNLTLAALVQELGTPAPKVAFVNAENLPLPLNIKQVSVKHEAGLTASRQLAILGRDDFDLFGVSVINDVETGEEVAGLAARHLVLAGVLADNASGALGRLEDLHIKPTVITPLPLGIGQTFVRRLCEHCREAYQPRTVELQSLEKLFRTDKPEILKDLHKLEQLAKADGLGASLPFGSTEKTITRLYQAKPHGCAQCDHTGYAGDIGLFEVCKPSANVQKSLLERSSVSRLEKAAIEDGMVSLKVDGFIKALCGLIDLPTLLAAVSNSNLSTW